ncbi:MAG: hypothetical protein H0V09_02885, partial [Gemmatimonadetes bacterium]|nr:hypothetical protein [Gemmatimonadota bacterium]
MTLAGVLGLVLIVVIAALVTLQTDWGRERVRLLALGRLRGMVNGRVDVARIRGDFLNGIALEGVSITGPAGEPLLDVGRFGVQYDLQGLLRREILLGEVVLEKPRILLVQDAAGQWNYERILPFLAPKEQPEPEVPGGWGSVVRLSELRISEGSVGIRTVQPGRGFGPLGSAVELAELTGKVDLEIANRGGENRRRFGAEDVSFVLASPRLAVRELDARAEITPERVKLERFLFRTASTELAGEGEVREMTKTPVLDLTFRADPLTLSDVRPFVPAMPALEGRLSGGVKLEGPSDSLGVTLQDLALATARSRMTADGRVLVAATPVVDARVELAPLDPEDARAVYPAYPLEEPLRATLASRGARERMEIDGRLAFGTTEATVAGTVGYPEA